MARCLATPLRFLPLKPEELALGTVVKSGQSFRWHKMDTVHATRPDAIPLALKSEPVDLKCDGAVPAGEEWALGWGDRTVVLRQDTQGLHYRSLYPTAAPYTAYLADLASDTTLPLLKSYFRLETPLKPLYDAWATADPNFAKKIGTGGEGLKGIRVLQQDPWEALVAFICSANNNIPRITQMVNKLCSNLGNRLPHPTAFTPSSTFHSVSSFVPPPSPSTPSPSATSETLYSFPPPSALTPSTIPLLLRDLGFGYRAPYIHATANHLLTLPSDHLASLHKTYEGATLEKTRTALLEFKGVGPKVADCVALFSLGWDDLVPVDTHVFQIAIRDYAFPCSRTTSLTPVLHGRVASRLQSIWGSHAGWCQQVLFFADLKPSTATSSPDGKSGNGKVVVKKEEQVVVKAKWQEELEELERNPGQKRRAVRKITTKVEVVKVKVEKVTKAVKVEQEEETTGAYPSPPPTVNGKRRRACSLSSEEASPSKRRTVVKMEA